MPEEQRYWINSVWEAPATVNWDDGTSRRISVQLRKRGYTVSGSIAVMEGKREDKEYKLKGRYSRGLLNIRVQL